MAEAKDAPRPHPGKGKGKGKRNRKGKSPRTPRSARSDKSAPESHENLALPVGTKAPVDAEDSKRTKSKEKAQDIFVDSMEMEETKKGNSGPVQQKTQKMPALACFDDRMNTDREASVSDPSEDEAYEKEVAAYKEKLATTGTAMNYIAQQRQISRATTNRKLIYDNPDLIAAAARGEGVARPDEMESSVMGPQAMGSQPVDAPQAELEIEPGHSPSLKKFTTKQFDQPEQAAKAQGEERRISTAGIATVKQDELDEYETNVHIRAKEVRLLMEQENFNAAPIYPQQKKRGRRKHVEPPKNPKVDEFHDIFREKVAALGIPGTKVDLRTTVDPTIAVKDTVAKYLKYQEENADALGLENKDRVKKGHNAAVLLGEQG